MTKSPGVMLRVRNQPAKARQPRTNTTSTMRSVRRTGRGGLSDRRHRHHFHAAHRAQRFEEGLGAGGRKHAGGLEPDARAGGAPSRSPCGFQRVRATTAATSGLVTAWRMVRVPGRGEKPAHSLSACTKRSLALAETCSRWRISVWKERQAAKNSAVRGGGLFPVHNGWRPMPPSRQ
jgi:hypothetical protein